MKFGLRVPPCVSPQGVAETVVRAEAEGFDYAWVPDSQLLWRDVWVTMGAIGARTSRILLGTNVSNPVTRHVTVTASAAAAMDELTGGRFVLGIGSGDSSVRVMGWKSAKIAEMREYIELLRPLWRGEFVAPYGPRIHLKGATGRPVPVYVSATGPKMLQFAGAIADGVIVVAGVAKDSLENALASVEIGARGAGRRLEDLDIVTGTFCHISEDWRSAMDLARPYAAVYLSRYPDSLRSFGIPEATAKDISGIYPDMAHAEDWDRAVELSRWVPQDVLEAFCEKFCLMGTADEVAAKVKRMAGYGVRSLYIRGFYSYAMPTSVAEAFARTVIPRFRGGER